MKAPSLAQLQEHFKNLLIHRGSLQQKIEAFELALSAPIDTLVKASNNIDPQRRIEVYSSGYVLRLLECMEADFPLLKKFTGPELFNLFAKAYIIQLPSTSWSLYEYGEDFAAYLQKTRPATDSLPAIFLELPALIAAIERTKSSVLLAKGTENMLLPSLQALYFTPLLATTHFSCPDSAAILKQPYPILELLEALEKDQSLSYPDKKDAYLAISRVQYRIQHTPLTPWQYYFLLGSQQGKSLAKIHQSIQQVQPMSFGEFQARLAIWLPIAFQKGLLIAS